MRSRSNSTESPTRPKLSQQRPKDHHEEEVGYSGRGNVQRRQKEKDDVAQASTILRSPKAKKKQRSSFKKREDLSRDDLLFLLSVLEGELQAQDEVIGVLKAEKIDLALLEAQYGFVTPKKVLEALQRDAIQTKAEQWQEDIYEKPMGELDKVVEKQKETHRRMLEQLIMVEKSHRQTLYELEEEKKKHSKYMEKSDEFTNLLEQECERLLYGGGTGRVDGSEYEMGEEEVDTRKNIRSTSLIPGNRGLFSKHTVDGFASHFKCPKYRGLNPCRTVL